MPVSPVDIITYLGGTVRSPGGNTLRRILSRFAPRCRCVGDVAWYIGIGGRKWGIVSGGDSGTGGYVSSFTLAHTALSITVPLPRPRRIAVLRDILHISAYRPRRFRHCSPAPAPTPVSWLQLPIQRRIILLVRRLPDPASQLDSTRFWYRACSTEEPFPLSVIE